MSMHRYNFFLHSDEYEALTKAAERRRVSRSQLLRDILDRVFKLNPPPADDERTTATSSDQTPPSQ
jgi:hypothetical protein